MANETDWKQIFQTPKFKRLVKRLVANKDPESSQRAVDRAKKKLLDKPDRINPKQLGQFLKNEIDIAKLRMEWEDSFESEDFKQLVARLVNDENRDYAFKGVAAAKRKIISNPKLPELNDLEDFLRKAISSAKCWDELFSSHEIDRVYALIAGYLITQFRMPKSEAYQFAHDVVVKIMLKCPVLDDETKAVAYVRKTAYNMILDVKRKEKQGVETSLDSIEIEFGSEKSKPDRSLAEDEDAELLRRQLEEFSASLDDNRRALLIALLLDIDIHEVDVSEKLKTDPKALAQAKCRLRRKLKQFLDQKKLARL